MPVDDITLDSINSIKNHKEKIQALNDQIGPAVGLKNKKKPDVKGLIKICKFVVTKVGEHETSVSKPVLQFLADQLEEVDEDFNNELMDVCKAMVGEIGPKYSFFAPSLMKVTRVLAELHQSESEYRDAGKAMASVDTDDQYYAAAMTIVDRCSWRIQTAEFFLADEDNTAATTHIQKARKLLRDVPLQHAQYQELLLRHKTCYSRILDSERQFLQASVNYLELSQMSPELVAEADLLMSLENAVTCAILAPAGGNRTRVLSMLYLDERARSLKNFKILEKMHKNMLLPKKEQDDFDKTLQDHHRATLAGGLTVLQKAVYEHNMLAASLIYSNVRISELAKLLGVNDMQAEDLARGMIVEGRMKASIDQVDQIIEFESDASILLDWDKQIQDLCMAVNDVVDQIDVHYPNVFVIP